MRRNWCNTSYIPYYAYCTNTMHRESPKLSKTKVDPETSGNFLNGKVHVIFTIEIFVMNPGHILLTTLNLMSRKKNAVTQICLHNLHS